MVSTTWPTRHRSSSSRTSTTDSSPTLMPSPSSTGTGTKGAARARLGQSLGHHRVDRPHGGLGGGRSDVESRSSSRRQLSSTPSSSTSMGRSRRLRPTVVPPSRRCIPHGPRDPGPACPSRSRQPSTCTLPSRPDTGLHDGQAVTVRWSGYTAGKVVNILECSHVDIASASSAGCSFAHAAILHPDPTGSGSAVLQVGTGYDRQWCLRRGAQLLRHREQCQLHRPGRHQGTSHPVCLLSMDSVMPPTANGGTRRSGGLAAR